MKSASITAVLVRHEVHAVMIERMNKMLSQGVIRLEANATKQALVVKGCSQEGVLSPLLWNLVVNDLITTLKSNHQYTIGCADDIVIRHWQ